MTERMRRPAGLGSRGIRFWELVTTTYELAPGEWQLLVEACRVLDEINALERTVRRDGVTVKGPRDDHRPHPALSDLRQHRLALGKVLAQLDFPDGHEIPSLTTIRARRAAASRWAGHTPRRRRRAATR